MRSTLLFMLLITVINATTVKFQNIKELKQLKRFEWAELFVTVDSIEKNGFTVSDTTGSTRALFWNSSPLSLKDKISLGDSVRIIGTYKPSNQSNPNKDNQRLEIQMIYKNESLLFTRTPDKNYTLPKGVKNNKQTEYLNYYFQHNFRKAKNLLIMGGMLEAGAMGYTLAALFYEPRKNVFLDMRDIRYFIFSRCLATAAHIFLINGGIRMRRAKRSPFYQIKAKKNLSLGLQFNPSSQGFGLNLVGSF